MTLSDIRYSVSSFFRWKIYERVWLYFNTCCSYQARTGFRYKMVRLVVNGKYVALPRNNIGSVIGDRTYVRSPLSKQTKKTANWILKHAFRRHLPSAIALPIVEDSVTLVFHTPKQAVMEVKITPSEIMATHVLYEREEDQRQLPMDFPITFDNLHSIIDYVEMQCMDYDRMDRNYAKSCNINLYDCF